MSGWVDVGLAPVTHVLDFEVRLRRQVPAEFNFDGLAAFSQVRFYTRAASGASNLGCSDLGSGVSSFDTMEAVLEHFSGGFSQTVRATGAGSCGTPPWFGPFVCAYTLGPLRLGVTLTAGQVLRYAWFTDASTTETWTIDGVTVKTGTYSNPPALLTGFSWGRTLRYGHAPGYSGVSATNASVEAATFRFGGTSLGLGTFTFFPNNSALRFFGPPYAWTIDLAAIDESGSALTVDATHYALARTTPSTYTRTVTLSGDATQYGTLTQESITLAALADPWLSAQTVTPYASDRDFICEGQAPKNPAAAYTTWNVGTLTIASPVAVLLSTTAFTATGSLVVSGPTNTPTFTVSAAGASASKTLRSHWRNWNNPANPDGLYISGENYTATKRTAYAVDGNTPDAWGWGLFSYLDVDFTVPGASTLTFRITWAAIDETSTPAAPVIRAVTRDYTKTWSASGTQRIDLLFPDAGDVPFYGERVDSITILGFGVGVYTLNSMQLVADEQAYLKLGGTARDVFGNPEPSGVMLSQDGQFAFAHWGGDSYEIPSLDRDGDSLTDRTKDQQNGIMEWAATEADPVTTNSFGGAPGMSAVDVQAVFTELNRLEGLTATYDGTAMEAALTDTDGNVLPTGRAATWLTPTLPHARLTKNVAYTVTARLVATTIEPVAGRTTGQQVFFQRWRTGIALEAQTKTAAGARGGAGQTVTARYNFTGATGGGDPSLGSATTDASGFVTVPVRAGRVGGSEVWLYLE